MDQPRSRCAVRGLIHCGLRPNGSMISADASPGFQYAMPRRTFLPPPPGIGSGFEEIRRGLVIANSRDDRKDENLTIVVNGREV